MAHLKNKNAAATRPPRSTTLLIATRKGLWTLAGDAARRTWKLAGPAFSRQHRAPRDARSARRQDAARRGAHRPSRADDLPLDGPRPHVEGGRNAARVQGGQRAHRRSHVLADAGHATEPGVWYAGTSPQGLFRSTDGGVTWTGVDGFNDHPQRKAWCGGDQDGTPDGPKLHSILVDPRDAKHMYIGMSSGGVFESVDAGARLEAAEQRACAPISCRTPIPSSATIRIACGCIRCAPGPALSAEPLRHLSARSAGGALDRHRRVDAEIGRLDRLSDGAASARSGYAVGVSDGRDRASGRAFRRAASLLCIARSTAARPGSGRRPGCRKAQAWWTVKRQAMTADQAPTVGVYFGTTSGEVWGSRDEGRTWKCLARASAARSTRSKRV